LSIAVQALVVVLLFLVNGIFAMFELAVMTARRSRLERLARSG